MSHPSLVIHSWSLCGLITPSAPKSATRIEVASEFPKVQPRSQQEPWTWLQNSQAGIAVTSFNCLDCGFLSGNIWTSREVLGHPFLMEEIKTQRQTWSLQNRGGILQSSLPGNRQIAAFSDKHQSLGLSSCLIFTLLGLQVMEALEDNSAWSVSSQPLRNSLCMIKPPFWNVLVKL